MFKLIKLFFLIIIIGAVAGYFWLTPKLKYVKDNPGFCVNLTTQLFYCGTEADLKGTLQAASKKLTPRLPESVNQFLKK